MRGQKTAKNLIVSLILQIVVLVCGFIVPKLIISSFGSNVNGLISSITQFLAYITLLEAGIGPVVRAALYKPIAKKNRQEIINIIKAADKFFKSIATIFVIYIIILCFIFPVIVKNEFDNIYTISLIIIISLSTFCEYFFGMAYRLFLKANQETYIISYIQIFTTIINTIIVLILVKTGANIHIVKLGSACIYILRPILQHLYVKKRYNFDLNNAENNYKLENKWDGLSQHIAAVIHDNTDIAILTFFTSLTEVSVYSVYNLVIKGIKNLVDSLTGGVDAAFGDMIAKDEKKILNQNFSMYEFFYYTVISFLFICSLILIVPFINVYTNKITDVNYDRPIFASIMVIAELIYSLRIPYNTLTLSAGHFKQTMKGAWVEAILNIIISTILVLKLGIIGVAIGTLIAMSVRTAEFILYASKNILERNPLIGFKRIIEIGIEIICVVIINNLIYNKFKITNYFEWGIYAIIVSIITILVIIIFNITVNKKEVIEVTKKIKNIIMGRKIKNG